MSNKNDLVVKSNRLIEASYRLTLAEQRIILFAIVEARRTRKGLSAENFVDITAAAYAEVFEVPPKQAYEQIKAAGETLFRRYVVLYDTHPESGKPRKTEVRWLSAASYIDGAGTIQISFAPKMVPFITRLEAQFTRYQLEKVAKMSSAYAIRLYELLMQWGSVGKREVELQWLRKALQLEDEYPSIKNFKKRVIEVAMAQINAHSDLTVSYTQRKTGRTVTHLTFIFEPKENTQAQPASAPVQDTPAGIRDSELFHRLRGHGISAKLALAWIARDETRALATVDYVEARAKAGSIKGSTAGYLRTLFELEAEVGPSPFAAGLQAEAEESAERARQREAAAKRAEQDRSRRDREARAEAQAWFEALPAAAQQALEAAFLAEANPVDAGMFRAKGRPYTGFRLFVQRTWRETRPA